MSVARFRISPGGPSKDSREPYFTDALVNRPDMPHLVENDHFVGRILFRVKHWTGLPGPANLGGSPDSTDYFDKTTRKRNFSITVQGRWKQPISTDDVFFGAFFTHKVVTPSGTFIAMKLATLIDPGLMHDLYSDNPWCCSSLLSSMNNVVISEAPTVTFPKKDWNLGPLAPTSIQKSIAGNFDTPLLSPWPLSPNDEENIDDQEDTSLWFKDTPPYDTKDATQRRHYFRKSSNRKNYDLDPNHEYTMSMYAPFLSMSTLELDLGVKIPCAKYFNGPLRMYMLGRRQKEKEKKSTFAKLTGSLSSSTGDGFWPEEAIVFFGLEIGMVDKSLNEAELKPPVISVDNVDYLISEDGIRFEPTEEEMKIIVAEMSSLYSRPSEDNKRE